MESLEQLITQRLVSLFACLHYQISAVIANLLVQSPSTKLLSIECKAKPYEEKLQISALTKPIEKNSPERTLCHRSQSNQLERRPRFLRWPPGTDCWVIYVLRSAFGWTPVPLWPFSISSIDGYWVSKQAVESHCYYHQWFECKLAAHPMTAHQGLEGKYISTMSSKYSVHSQWLYHFTTYL